MKIPCGGFYLDDNVFTMQDGIISLSDDVLPSGSISITSNGEIDVSKYATANVNVVSSSYVELVMSNNTGASITLTGAVLCTYITSGGITEIGELLASGEWKTTTTANVPRCCIGNGKLKLSIPTSASYTPVSLTDGVTVSKSGQAIVLDGLLSVAQGSRVEIKLT